MVNLDSIPLTALTKAIKERGYLPCEEGIIGLAAAFISEVDAARNRVKTPTDALSDFVSHNALEYIALGQRYSDRPNDEVGGMMPSEGGLDVVAGWLMKGLIDAS